MSNGDQKPSEPDDISLEQNIRLIQVYAKEKKTGNEFFDISTKFTCFGLAEAVEWVDKNIKVSG